MVVILFQRVRLHSPEVSVVSPFLWDCVIQKEAYMTHGNINTPSVVSHGVCHSTIQKRETRLTRWDILRSHYGLPVRCVSSWCRLGAYPRRGSVMCSCFCFYLPVYLSTYSPFFTAYIHARTHDWKTSPFREYGFWPSCSGAAYPGCRWAHLTKEIGFLCGLRFFALNIFCGNTYNRVYIWCCKYGENR